MVRILIKERSLERHLPYDHCKKNRNNIIKKPMTKSIDVDMENC